MRKLFILLLTTSFLVIGCRSYETSKDDGDNIKNVYCSSCGVESKEKTRFCPDCGAESTWLAKRPILLEKTKSDKANAINTDYTYKYEYLSDLDNLEESINNSYSLYEEESRSKMAEVEEMKLETWNNMLDDIYILLKTQLSESEFEELKNEQISWLDYRESTAKNDANKFEGMEFARVQYNSYLVKLTKERCYELVNAYM